MPEKFEPNIYRDSLAEEIKDEPDKEKRHDILNREKKTETYKTARNGIIAERKENLEEKKNIGKLREKLRGGESEKDILFSAEKFTEELTRLYPQVSESGELNYYLSGSLAVMLLLQSKKFEILDESKIPGIQITGKKELSDVAVKRLGGFVRKIGDLDYVPTEQYKKQAERLKKGGGGPKMTDLSDEAKKVLKLEEDTSAVMCDPLVTVTSDRVARVEIDGREVYITEPKMMLAYKAVHLAQTFSSAEKTPKFVSDFNAMVGAMEEIYPPEELLAAAHEIIFAYCPDDPNNTFVHYYNPQFRGTLRKFFNETLKVDKDYNYLEQLKYGKERAVGVLKILHHFEPTDSKQQIIDFINQRKDEINQWDVSSSSSKNLELLTDFVMANPDVLANFLTHTDGDSTREAVKDALKINVWAFRDYGEQMPNKNELDMLPSTSKVMDILAKISVKNTKQELASVGKLLDSGVDEYMLESLFRDTENNLEDRQNLLNGLMEAREVLNENDFDKFAHKLYAAISGYNKDKETPASVFSKFGLKYKL